MKILYLDCGMGASGDMLLGALLELAGNQTKFLKTINSIGIPRVKISRKTLVKNGVAGNKVFVRIDGLEEGHHHGHSDTHSHHHRKLQDVNKIINKLKISKGVKDAALAVYQSIAQAEGKAHNCEVSQIHFHEVGELDAISDIVGTCMLIEELNAGKIIASPVNVGGGFVKCAHGVLPVPAPAAAELLKGVPVYSGEIKEELCTPTGAALLKYFVNEFSDMPQMKIDKIGYGFGSKEFETLNAVRAFIGETPDSLKEEVVKLECNLDDMTGEEIGFAFEKILENGALDVWTAPIQMKKNRPAVLFSVLCKKEQADFFAKLILKHTTTFGVRQEILSRHILDRKIKTKITPYGKIRIKAGFAGAIKKSKPEYEDVRTITAEFR
jgi:uncharacterized protein (TIGR00299 family) protein